MKTKSNARFDARISKEQKEFFLYAANLAGFSSLSEFVISSAHEKANRIVSEYDTILSSDKDKEIFFNALLNPTEPNENLKAAAKLYEEFLSNE